MIVVRTGAVIALTVAALVLLVVRPALEGTRERAFDRAHRMLDGTGKQILEPLSPAGFASAVTRIKRALGPGAELLGFTVTTNGGNVKYRTIDGAAGYQWGPGRDGMEPVGVTLVGGGRVADFVFPIAQLDHAVGAKLIAGNARLRELTLQVDPAARAPRWTVSTATTRYSARPDGSRVRGAR